MYPPRKGAIPLPVAVAELSRDILSPRLTGNCSAMVASVTGTKIAVRAR
jgi:hypothetical protein